MSKQTTTDFDKKLKQALSDDPNEAIQALHNGGYPLCKYQKVLSAVSELVEECIGEEKLGDGVVKWALEHRAKLRAEIRQRFKERGIEIK